MSSTTADRSRASPSSNATMSSIVSWTLPDGDASRASGYRRCRRVRVAVSLSSGSWTPRTPRALHAMPQSPDRRIEECEFLCRHDAIQDSTDSRRAHLTHLALVQAERMFWLNRASSPWGYGRPRCRLRPLGIRQIIRHRQRLQSRDVMQNDARRHASQRHTPAMWRRHATGSPAGSPGAPPAAPCRTAGGNRP